MSLRDRFRRAPNGNGTAAAQVGELEPLAAPKNGHLNEYQEMTRTLHRELIGKLNMSSLEGLDDAGRREQVEAVTRRLLSESELRLTRSDEERLVQELLHDTFDLGPITPLLLDEEVFGFDVTVDNARRMGNG